MSLHANHEEGIAVLSGTPYIGKKVRISTIDDLLDRDLEPGFSEGILVQSDGDRFVLKVGCDKDLRCQYIKYINRRKIVAIEEMNC